ncbi:NADH dehydrogenase (ubiquinone) complex I, assembly factor 6 isoform X1 [Octopus sinensis]|uniref:NADH dehydrogenase (ubiquinone) complex I, assembly factor 6 n=1 Tax=Octopus sinensis TaxID=2607531 RepID=A0A6P7SIV7_9MOLL|nr:NADH dehydrogenase (ubiquinone) complex I, assembly factor 6 isoform X1 [Octopus sinensis]
MTQYRSFLCNRHVSYYKRQLLLWKTMTLNKSTKSGTTQNPVELCMNMVRKTDFENYLCTLLYPKSIRTSAFGLRAFNAEIAQVKDLTTDPRIGEIRLKYWQDVVNEIYQGKLPHLPVGQELARAVQKHNLSKHWLLRLIDARFTSLKENPFTSIKNMEDYAEKTVSSLHYLLLECLGIKNVHADHVSSHIGKAYGIITQLRGVPYHGSKRKVYLPLDVLIKHQVSEEAIVRGRDDQKVKDVIYDIASAAHQHLKLARDLKQHITKEMLPVFLSTVICEEYLNKLQKVDFHVFHPRLQQRDNLLPVKLWLQTKRAKY